VIEEPAAMAIGVDRAGLTPDAARHVDERGMFTIPAVRISNEEISEAQAREIARVVARDYAPRHQAELESHRQAPIDFGSLSQCGRVFYAASPTGVPAADMPSFVRKMYGAWYLVSMCGADGSAQVLIAISALDTDVHVVGDDIVFDRIAGAGNYWVMAGISAAAGGALPVPPEVAANLAARLSHRRVAGVPELIAPQMTRGVPPEFARWRVTLEAPALLTSAASGERMVSDVFVAVPEVHHGPVAMIAARVQPQEDTFGIRGPLSAGGSSSVNEFRAKPLAAMPLVVEPIIPNQH
jgi:hypothetical protein